MNIYEVPKERRYWVVRAESGRYYDHFIKNNLIALGHLNVLSLPDTPEGKIFNPNAGELTDSFKLYYQNKKEAKKQASSHLAQIKSFTYDMSVGDWVLTVGNNAIRFGRITSSPYINKNTLTVTYGEVGGNGRNVDMDFNLRREVQWGPKLLRNSLPYGLLRSLKANQTLFCVDSNWEAIYHSIYPAFRFENKLYLSAKITTKEKIKNYSITSFFKLLNEIEVIGKQFSLGESLDDFDEIFEKYIESDELSITTKAQFYSPGEIWNTITALGSNISLDNWATYTVAAYSMLFGNQKLGFDGLIDLETRKKIWEIVIERIKKNGTEKLLDSLQLEIPKEDTSKLESTKSDKP